MKEVHVLLVEDDAATIESVELCSRVFYPEATIVSVKTGGKALEVLSQQRIDIALLDLGLPDMDGITLLGKIREISDVPVIVLSARNNPEAIAEAQRLGIGEFISKPFNYNYLISRIKSSLKPAQP